jgi:hypothetical protein
VVAPNTVVAPDPVAAPEPVLPARPAEVEAQEPPGVVDRPPPAVVPPTDALPEVSDLESAFWSEDPGRETRRHLTRTVWAVGLQAVAVLIVLAVVLIRIG